MVPASGLGSTSNIQELISEIDQDGNGEISFNEFVWLMTRYLQSTQFHDIIGFEQTCFPKGPS